MMQLTRCNFCSQLVSFIEIRGNSTCPVCRQSGTSCCEGGSCSYQSPKEKETPNEKEQSQDNAKLVQQ